MIRVAFLDDHPAVRAGLAAIVAPEPDLHDRPALTAAGTSPHALEGALP